MKRVTILLAVAALLAVAPRLARAQFSDMDRQNPKEYNDNDSQPLNLVSYLLRPVGYALEWGVARPLHYLATDSPLAPVMGANTDADSETLPPITALPLPDEIPESKSTVHHETVIRRGGAPPPETPAANPPSAANPANQPILH